MSGDRSHLEKTITCVSERSGMASMGIFLRAIHPPTAATATRRKIKNRFRAEKSIILSIIVVTHQFPAYTCSFLHANIVLWDIWVLPPLLQPLPFLWLSISIQNQSKNWHWLQSALQHAPPQQRFHLLPEP